MSIEVVVRLRTDEAAALRARSPDTPALRAVLEAAAELGVALDPADSAAAGSALAGWFVAYVADPDLAQEVVDRLAQCDAVEAAYIKPPAELP